MTFLFRPVSISSTYCNGTMLQRLHACINTVDVAIGLFPLPLSFHIWSRPVSISSTYYNGTKLQRLHVLTLLMYWALSFALIASYMIYSVGFCSKQASVTS